MVFKKANDRSAKIVGYDPGGNHNHGLAVLTVEKVRNSWRPRRLKALSLFTIDAVMEHLRMCDSHPRDTLAVGIDTLTAWNTGPAQWRPADQWLRDRYRRVKQSVQTPARLGGSMTINGALFLKRFRQLKRSLSVTEAHPKVCYYAATKRKHLWGNNNSRRQMLRWLNEELGLEADQVELETDADHPFDAAIGALAALRGVNGDWTHDLHSEPPQDNRPGNIHPFGTTHYWWPE